MLCARELGRENCDGTSGGLPPHPSPRPGPSSTKRGPPFALRPAISERGRAAEPGGTRRIRARASERERAREKSPRGERGKRERGREKAEFAVGGRQQGARGRSATQSSSVRPHHGARDVREAKRREGGEDEENRDAGWWRKQEEAGPAAVEGRGRTQKQRGAEVAVSTDRHAGRQRQKVSEGERQMAEQAERCREERRRQKSRRRRQKPARRRREQGACDGK